MKKLFFPLLLLIGCNAAQEKAGSAEQTGGKRPVMSDSVAIQVIANTTDHELISRDEFDNYTNYNQGKIHIPLPYVIEDIHWRHQTHFIINRSYDSLQFVLSEPDNFWMIKSPNEKNERELNFEVAYRKEKSPIPDMKAFDDMIFHNRKSYLDDLEARDQAIDSVFNIKLSYLSDYHKKYNLSEEFLQDWQKFIRYERAESKLFMGDFPNSNNEYFSKLSRLSADYNDDSSLQNPSYRRGAWTCLRLLSHLSPNKKKSNLKIFAGQINDHFTGLTKEYLTTSLLRYAKEDKKYFATTPNEYDSLQTAFISTARSEKYKDYIVRSATLEKLVIDTDQVVSVSGRAVKLNSLLTKGKIHYIDFWASWCAPCIAEMPASKKLKEKYTGKAVNFLYFSRDDNPVAWEKAANRLGFSATESYLMPAKRESALATKLKISAIPRYVIMDDKGNILDRDAPRPSDPKIVKVLDELLKN